MNENTTLGYSIFSDLDKNEYLNEIYRAILYDYAIVLFGLTENQPEEFDLDDALRFADLLSKSNGVPNSEMHHLWAQEIVALLNELYPGNDTIRYYTGSVLSSVGNFRGVSLRAEGYRSDNVFEQLVTEIRKEYLRICHLKVVFGTFPAGRFGFAELTVGTGLEFTFTCIGKFGGWNQRFVCPAKEFFLCDFVGADVVAPWLEDGQADTVYIVEAVQQFNCA